MSFIDDDINDQMLDLAEEEAARYEQNLVINATTDDATTCPSCRVAVTLGQTCPCPMKWKG